MNLLSISVALTLTLFSGFSLAISCKVNDPDISTEYSGDCQNGLANGYGFAKGHDEYKGSFSNGNKHGTGTYTWPNGSRHEGDWVNDRPSGKGVFTWPDGRRYEGMYRDGSIHGNGRFTWPEGNNYKEYIGEFSNSKRTCGKMFFWDGDSYEGCFDPEGKMKGKTAMQLAADAEIKANNGKWITDPKSGCKTLFPFGALTDGLIENKWDQKAWSDPNIRVTDAKWDGKCENGLALGKGTLAIVFKLYPNYSNYPHVFNTFKLDGEVVNGVFIGEVSVSSKWHDSFITAVSSIAVLDGKALSVREYIKKTDPAKYKTMLANEHKEAEAKRREAEKKQIEESRRIERACDDLYVGKVVSAPLTGLVTLFGVKSEKAIVLGISHKNKVATVRAVNDSRMVGEVSCSSLQ